MTAPFLAVPLRAARFIRRAARRCVRRRSLLVALGVVAVPLSDGAAQGAGRCDAADRIRRVDIDGALLAADEVSLVLATRGPSLAWRLLRLGEAPCLDPAAPLQDALRIAVLHRQRGWFRARVEPAVTSSPAGSLVRFTVIPGPLARIGAIAVRGLPAGDSAVLAAPLEALAGQPFDRVRVQAVADRTVGALRDAGFARALLRASDVAIDSAAAVAVLTLTFDPGRRFRLGAIDVEVEPLRSRAARFPDETVRALAGLSPGDRYRAADMLAAQAALYRTEAFRLVLLDTLPREPGPSQAPAVGAATAEGVLDVRIRVADARTRSARLGAGWGTLECGRVAGSLTDRSFLGAGRRVELTARASRLGIGRPVDQFPGLCPQFLRDDPYSQELNYFVGVSLANSTFFGTPWSPTLDVYSERRGEFNAFQLETDLGVGFALTRAVTPRLRLGGGVEQEAGRIVTDPVLACVRFALCQPADLALARQGNTTQAMSVTWLYDRVGAVADPRDGGRLRADLRAGRTRFGDGRLRDEDGDARRRYDFVRPTLEASGFTRLGGGTLAARVQWAQVYAPRAFLVGGAPFLPPQERLYAGGQNTVRGFQQNLLGPVVYRVDRAGVAEVPVGDAIQLVVRPDAAVRLPSPEGGSGSLVANLEYRRRFTWPTPGLQWALFVDAGTVWADGAAAFAAGEVRATPGIGVRVATPLGPFRIDVGYNPHPPEAGKVFLFDAFSRAGKPSSLFVVCVSPGQSLTFDEQLAAGGLECPRTFRPEARRTRLSRLVFHFSLGQAF